MHRAATRGPRDRQLQPGEEARDRGGRTDGGGLRLRGGSSTGVNDEPVGGELVNMQATAGHHLEEGVVGVEPVEFHDETVSLHRDAAQAEMGKPGREFGHLQPEPGPGGGRAQDGPALDRGSQGQPGPDPANHDDQPEKNEQRTGKLHTVRIRGKRLAGVTGAVRMKKAATGRP